MPTLGHNTVEQRARNNLPRQFANVCFSALYKFTDYSKSEFVLKNTVPLLVEPFRSEKSFMYNLQCMS